LVKAFELIQNKKVTRDKTIPKVGYILFFYKNKNEIDKEKDKLN
jgi:hypothetical protein